jgi:hypothetical protein
MADVTKSIKNLKVSGDIVDLVLAGIVKYFAEKALTPLVGNGNIWSGLTKLGIGVGLDMFGGENKIAKIGKTAMVLDGVEDVTQFVIKMITNKVPALNGGNNAPAMATI